MPWADTDEAQMVKIGVIGTGLMGAPMALRLMSAGYQVWVYNRTQPRLKPLELAGAKVCQTPDELLQAVDAVILMVTDAAAIRSLLPSPPGEATDPASQRSPLNNLTVIQMGTIAPAESQALHQQLADLGASYLEAPVLGSIPEAKTGKLIVMVGADAEQYQRWQPLLECFGSTLYHVGPVGTAAALKLAMNQLIGSLTAAFAQSLSLIQAAGIDVETFMAVVRQSALYAPTFDKKLKRMQSGNFADPNFPTKHLLKDMGLFTEAAQAADLNTLPAESVRQLVAEAVQAGFSEDDYSSIVAMVRSQAQP
ncbi:NAD(P)-dependent oxidoreductase [Nodosilinea sp. P-1105]|uniref:NAD(P)-dependent oxidoreductase n=1 Tax=Nodosilinea sp. P-1105 TaxID=2546229 RepID=UPI003242C209